MNLTLTRAGKTGDLMRFHRAHFHGVLLSNLPPSCTTHSAKRLKSYTQPSNDRSSHAPITLTFTDGTTATCDVLIGADGIKSAVRCSMMRELAESMDPCEQQSVLSCINPVWSGVTAYRTLVSAEKLRARCPDHPALREHIQVSLTPVTCHSSLTWHRLVLQYLGKDAVRRFYS